LEAATLSTDEFIRIGDAARLLAFHLGQRFASNGHAHLGTARDKLLNAAKEGDFPIVAGTESWSVAASFALPAALLLPRLQRPLNAASRLPLALPPRLHLLCRLHRHRHRHY